MVKFLIPRYPKVIDQNGNWHDKCVYVFDSDKTEEGWLCAENIITGSTFSFNSYRHLQNTFKEFEPTKLLKLLWG